MNTPDSFTVSIDGWRYIMDPEVRKVLDLIDDALVAGDTASDQLWHVLTALRGPDSGNNDLKAMTTTHVRMTAFPKFFEAQQSGSIASVMATIVGQRMDQNQMYYCNSDDHFLTHIYYAFKALAIDR